MNRGEFYSSSEYNATSEYKHLPAEVYIKPQEENTSGKEVSNPECEVTTIQPKSAPQKGSGESKTLIDKIFGSIRGVATAATVAVSSIVITTTFVTGAPKTELVDLSCGDTYVEYEMNVTGLEEDGEYAIVVSTSNEDDVEIPIDEDGNYKNRIDGLKPDWEYTLALVRYDSPLGEVRHFETKFQTLAVAIPEPIPPPDPAPPAQVPTLDITDIEAVGLNRVDISFTHKNLPSDKSVILELLYENGNTGSIILQERDLTAGYVTTYVEPSDSMTVNASIIENDDTNDESMPLSTYTHIFEKTLRVHATVGLYETMVVFYPIGIISKDEYISIHSSEWQGEADVWTAEGSIWLEYVTVGEIRYTLYVTNETGDVLSNVVTVDVDTSVEIPAADFIFNAPNPNDVGITYNEDGTINMYLSTDFSAEDESIYYQITASDIRFTSRESIARMEYIADKSYALQYDVCIDVGGVQYSIFRLVPSGMANEQSVYFNVELEGKVITLGIYKDEMHVDLNSITLTTASGEVISLSEEDFVYDGDSGAYNVTVEFQNAPEYVTVRLKGNPQFNGLSGIDEYIGDTRKFYEETAYQP